MKFLPINNVHLYATNRINILAREKRKEKKGFAWKKKKRERPLCNRREADKTLK